MVTKGHTYLKKLEAFNCRSFSVRMTFCYHQTLKDHKHLIIFLTNTTFACKKTYESFSAQKKWTYHILLKFEILYKYLTLSQISLPTSIYLLKVNNRNTWARCEICLKLTIKTPERHHWRCSGVFLVNFEHISHLVLVVLLLTLHM